MSSLKVPSCLFFPGRLNLLIKFWHLSTQVLFWEAMSKWRFWQIFVADNYNLREYKTRSPLSLFLSKFLRRELPCSKQKWEDSYEFCKKVVSWSHGGWAYIGCKSLKRLEAAQRPKWSGKHFESVNVSDTLWRPQVGLVLFIDFFWTFRMSIS